MEIRVSKESEVPVRQQLAEQIAFLIATEKLKAGQALPSVRELARRLKIHHNTVSHAYQDLVRRTWLVRKRGSRVVVRSREEAGSPADARDFDALLNTLIRVAREGGLSLQALRERLRERLLAEPPDHFLVVDQEVGLRQLLGEEIHEALGWPAECCSREELAANPGLAIGAVVVTPQYALNDVEPLVPKDRMTVPIAFSAADALVEKIQRLNEPSIIAVVSASANLLKTAESLLAPAIGRRHTLSQFLLPVESPNALRSADVVFCDTISMRSVKHPSAVHYQVIAPESIQYLRGAVPAYETSGRAPAKATTQRKAAKA